MNTLCDGYMRNPLREKLKRAKGKMRKVKKKKMSKQKKEAITWGGKGKGGDT